MIKYFQSDKVVSSLRIDILKVISFFSILIVLFGCSSSSDAISQPEIKEPMVPEASMEEKVEGVDYFLPHIDLNHWKVTLPIGNPTEVEPPAILDYAKDPLLQKYMYNDSTDGALVFYTSPGSSTQNSSYSRTELREQMVPGSNTTNWTFAQGAYMKGQLKMDDISKDADENYHRTIIMQIHGRLTNAQRDLIGEDDNNAPPVLKIYWNKGRVRVLRKVLKDTNIDNINILTTDAWTDEGHWLEKEVGFEKFQLEVIVSDGRMEVVLDEEERLIFDDIHMKKWGVFENYFKAGNYLASADENAYATVKYYDLEISH